MLELHTVITPYLQTKIIGQTQAIDNTLFNIGCSASDIKTPICLTPETAIFNMSEPSSLTATGLLYEGNFKEWEPRMRAILAQNGCTFQALLFRLLSSGAAKEMATIIWCHTSPNVKVRVPNIYREDPYTLIRALRKRARPFRLMDLPPEVRLKICLYDSPPSNSKEIFLLEPPICSRDFENTKKGMIESPLLSINRQLRLELLPVYLKTASFDLRFTYRHDFERTLRDAQLHPEFWPRPTNAERVCAMNAWVLRSKPDSLNLLREVSVQLPLLAVCNDRRDDMLDIRVEFVEGNLELKVEKHPWLKPDSRLLLEDHASAISKLAQSLKLQGEALALFLTSRPDMWDELELADGLWYVVVCCI